MRHEYQLTFKGPTITPPNSNEVPFFDVGGHVVTGKDRIRLTTSLPNQQGWIWSKTASSFDGFQIDLVFKISGTGRVGADGLALWVTQARSHGGPAIGASGIFNGIGILFDTFDQYGHRRSPFIHGIVNDGTKTYRLENDGQDVSVGHCAREYRNMPYPIHCRVTYFKKVLMVNITSGYGHQDPAEMEECFRANVDLQKAEYFYGLTSSTGQFADDHDVEKMEVHSLTEVDNVKAEEERKRLEDQKRYEEEFQHNMDNIAKSPETTQEKPKEDLGEKGITQNLIAIWHEIAGQHKSMKNLLKTVEFIHAGVSGDDKNILKSQFDTVGKDILDLKSHIESLSRKMENSGNTFQNQQAFTQIHNSMDGLKSDLLRVFDKVETVLQAANHIKDNDGVRCVADTCGTCLSVPLMVVLGSLQSAFVIGFLIYQKSKDSAAKKFY